MRRRSRLSHISLAALVAVPLWIDGCVPTAEILDPSDVPPKEGAIFGNIQAFVNGRDVTMNCHVVFEDPHGGPGDGKVQMPLSSDGWVFTSLPVGSTYPHVICGVPDGLTTGMAQYVGLDHAFDVLGKGTIVYFGHLNVGLHWKGTHWAAALFTPPAWRSLLPSEYKAPTTAPLDSYWSQAKREYLKRYGAKPGTLRPKLSAEVAALEQAKALYLAREAEAAARQSPTATESATANLEPPTRDAAHTTEQAGADSIVPAVQGAPGDQTAK